MKPYNNLVLAMAIALANGIGTPGWTQPKTATAEQIISRMSQTLQEKPTLRYRYQRELNYFSEGIHHELSADCYLDFSVKNPVLGFRYQVQDSDMLAVFNGSETFSANKRNGTLRVDAQPDHSRFESMSFFYNSPVTLRAALPTLLADQTIPKTVADTLIQKQLFYVVRFDLKQKTLGYLGTSYRLITLNRIIRYRLLIDQATWLPVEVVQSNNSNQDFTKTRFQYLDATNPPTDASWYYSSYLRDYQLVKPDEAQISMIEAGQAAPDWTLPVFDTRDSVTMTQLKGKVILLEFWIRNCGYCVADVPKLNALFQRYQDKNFRLLAINPHDSEETVAVFKQKIQPVYPLLYNGQAVARRYGVGAFPMVVLIDQTGQVIYSGSFDADRVTKLIDERL